MSAIALELPGAKVLDLYAGSGALGIEALSRGAEHTTFVESALAPLATLKQNLASIGAPPAAYTVVRADAIRFVETATEQAFDIAFANPPYLTGEAERLASAFISKPFARLLCVERAPTETISGDPIWERRYGDTVLTFLSAKP